MLLPAIFKAGIFTLLLFICTCHAQQSQACQGGICTIDYDADFFSQYAPITALDMVNNVPGFSINDGSSDTRGFNAATGNVLINGKRLSSKSESASDQLAIIPAEDVGKIQLLQGQLAAYDLSGQTIAVNVVRKSTSATGTVEFRGRVEQPASTVRPAIDASYTSKVNNIDYTASIELSDYQGINEGVERVFDANSRIVEVRDEVFDETGDFVAIVLTGTTQVNNTEINANIALEILDESGGEVSEREPQAATPFTLLQPDTDEYFDYEVGFDIQMPFSQDLVGKFIALLTSSDYTETGALTRQAQDEAPLTTSEFVFDSLTTEQILRLEADYSGIQAHLIEFSIEAAINELDSDFRFSILDNGQLTPVEVPGAMTLVEEQRVDMRLVDSFTWGSINVELAVAAEYSEIEQTGGFNAQRSFFFWKPSLSFTYPLSKQSQLQIRALREVGQLDFFDFTSATDLGDDELALGNPDLEPELTTTLDMQFEQRTTSISAFSASLFYDWIEDVEDIVPLQGVLEVPGNIGNGRRWGATTNFTLALDSVGLKNGRLDTDFRWQKSRVTDPLTQSSRELSGEEGWELVVDVRQDIESHNLAWGATYFVDDSIPEFGLDEKLTFSKNRSWDLFIEKRQLYGFRVRLSVDNIFRDGEERNRIVFNGPRTQNQIAFQELKDFEFSRTITLALSRTF